MSEGSGSTAGDDTSSIRPIGDANEETIRDTSGTTEEESSDVLTPSVDTTAQGILNNASSEAVPAEAESTLGVLNEGSSVSIESTESEEEVKEKPNTKHNVTHEDILYTGRMYHVEKNVGHWKIMYCVVRDLEVLIQYFDTQHPNAEPGDDVNSFNFVQPNGVLQLHLQTPQQLGWSVDPDREPMEIYQSTVDQFPSNPLYSSVSMSVYAQPGVAKKPLHCPIKLTGIKFPKTVYINRPLPPPPPSSNNNTTSTSSTTGASQTSRETEESTFRPEAAYRVMTECTSQLKRRIDLYSLAEKLLEKKIINAKQKSKATDELSGRTKDQRMDELLEIIKASVKAQGKVFGYILEILKDEDTIQTNALYDDMMNKYRRYVGERVSIDKDALAKWLQEGVVDIKVTRINMHGPSGAGKTCSQLLLLNQDPPAVAVTDSTPIACRAVKATRIFVDKGHLEKVDGNALLVRLASNLNVAALTRKKEKLKFHDVVISKVESSEASIIADSPKAPTQVVDHDSNKVCEDIVKAIPKANAKLGHHWVYIVDSGGQLVFQELLPLFTRAASFNIITIDLTKGVDEKLEYQYRIGGESFSCDPNFTCTNREFLMNVFSSGVVYNTPVLEDTAVQCPNYFVLGTHSDKATPKNIEDLNNALLSFSDGEEGGYHLISAKIGRSNEIVYPINTLKKGPGRQEAAKKLCDTIFRTSDGEKFSMPIRWFAFELALQEKAENNGCTSFLEMDDVLSAGRSLEMNEDDTKMALQHLHNYTIILHYPDVLPNIVFVDPHPILDTLSHLLALTYEIDRAFLHLITTKTPSNSELRNLTDNGIFTESLLSKLNDDHKFPKSDFIKLLLYLHVIAETKHGYFIPCALKSHSGQPPEADLKPLLIVWYNPDTEKTLPVPHGVFPLTIVHLMNHKEPQFHIPPSPSAEYFKYRDAMSFRIRLHGDQIGTIHIINKYKHIEVYFTGYEPAKYCPLLCELITEAVRCSSVAVGARQYHTLAFICSSKNKEKCYCIVTNEEEEKIECSFCPKPAIIKGQEYWNWFHYTPQSSSEESDPPRCLDITRLREVRKSLEKKQFFESEWEKLGDELGLYPNTLNTIKTNNPKDVSSCLRGMLLKWLQGADGVSGNGGSTWASLVNALESIGQRAVAEHIRCKWIKRKKPTP